MSDEAVQIGIVHSFYSTRWPSGENEVVVQQVDALNRAGVRSVLLSEHTDVRQQAAFYGFEAAWTVATGIGKSPLGMARAEGISVLHTHNLFPNFGKSWLRKWDGGLVATLHNYRPFCAAGTFVRADRLCLDCLDTKVNGLIHGCYRSSFAATLPVTLGQRGSRDEVLRRADRVIVMSPVQRELYVRAGVDEGKLVEVPHFVPDALDPGLGPGGEPWLFAGRLDAVKGADRLALWPPDVPLRIAGSGPLEGDLREALKGSRVEFLGNVSRREVGGLLRESRGVLSLSRAPETFGLIYVEALAAGTPVLAVPPGAPYTFVMGEGTGLAVEEFDRDALRVAHETFSGMRTRCRAAFESRYSEYAHVGSLMSLYSSL